MTDGQTVGGNTDITGGYPIGAGTSETMQSQQVMGNDVPVDQNSNAALCRSQNLTLDLAGKEFSAAAARRTILADAAMGKAAGT